MYKKFVLLALAVPFFLTGCWDKKDPEDRAFIHPWGRHGGRKRLSLHLCACEYRNGRGGNLCRRE